MAEEKTAPPPAGNKKKKIIIIAILAVVVLAGVGGVLAYLQYQMKQSETEATDKLKEAEQATEKDAAFAEVGEMLKFDDFILNLNTPGDSRYLKIGIHFELTEGLTAEVEKKKPVLQDILVSIISSKSYDEIKDARGKELLKEELVTALNRVLTTGRIRRIYFTEFVVQ
ncbi:MAG: hypothetical protein A2284_05520 [Deltaproteobacteria bacterium RIFOXYA12_FULL_61_11]|nr:MAG: hypothetical protein A2284_05520 [Deltaproteobacteria bacterium RIFOXYA12_FULL_61_11]